MAEVEVHFLEGDIGGSLGHGHPWLDDAETEEEAADVVVRREADCGVG